MKMKADTHNGRRMKYWFSTIASVSAMAISLITLGIVYINSQNQVPETHNPVTLSPTISATTQVESGIKITCINGFAAVHIPYRDSFDHLMVVRIEVPAEGNETSPITCQDNEFSLSGSPLTRDQLELYAAEMKGHALATLEPSRQGGGIPVINMAALTTAKRDAMKSVSGSEAKSNTAFMHKSGSIKPIVAVLEGSDQIIGSNGVPIVLKDKSAGCEYFGEIQESASGTNLLGLIEREKCGDTIRATRLMVLLGPIDGQPLLPGTTFRVYKQPKLLPSGAPVLDPAMLTDLYMEQN